MKWKLACADFTFPLLTHDQSLDLIAAIGFEGVDIGLFEGRSHLHPSVAYSDATKAGKELLRKVTDRGLKVADVFLQTDPDFKVYAVNHPDAERCAKARDWFMKTLEYASACASRHVTSLPGVSFEEETERESLARCHEELAWRVEQAADAGIVFGVEAHVGSITPTPPDALLLVESVPGLTLTLDYTHFASLGIPDTEAEPLIEYASHFHTRGACKDRIQASFKDNVIDYRRILDVMNCTGYSGYIAIEYVWIDWEHCNEVDNLSETILYRDFFQSLVASDTV